MKTYLTLAIDSDEFLVSVLPKNPEVRFAVTLTKINPLWKALSSYTPYTVAIGPFGITCECADFILRDKEHSGQPCRHITALKEVGLIR